MKLFGFGKENKKVKFHITQPDREWVEDNFKWLIQSYGYPGSHSIQYLFEEQYFPTILNERKITVENLIADLSFLTGIDNNKINFDIEKDIRDSYGTPYEFRDKPFETEVEELEDGYKIYIANFLISRPSRLLFCLVLDFIYIKLVEDKIDYDRNEDAGLFLYIAGVYFGYGVLLTQNMIDKGRANDFFWETKWHTGSVMPYEIITYALALHSVIAGLENTPWETLLPAAAQPHYAGAVKFLATHPTDLFDKRELEAVNLFQLYVQQYDNNDFEAAIESLQKILFLTKDDPFLAVVHGNIGYTYLRMGQPEKSIGNFQKALSIDKDALYAHDNLGYALIITGNPDEGKNHIDQAIRSERNDNAYSYRNLALYYQLKGQPGKAEEHFQLAFQHITMPVDLLELHYGNFLIEQGQQQKGLEYIQMAVEKGEPEAIQRMDELKH